MGKKIVRRSDKADKINSKPKPVEVKKATPATQKAASKAEKAKKAKEKKQFATTKKNKANFLKALRAKAGHVSDACEASKVGRATFYEWLKNDADFNDSYHNAKEDLLDFVEGKILQLIEGVTVERVTLAGKVIYKTMPNGRMAVEFMKAKGKQRGWTTRHELTGANGRPLGGGPAIGDDLTDAEATSTYLDNIRGASDDG